jgi:hypothetical protein
MTACCPYRHISYPSWRYQTFQWLFAASGNPSTGPLSLAQPHLTGLTRRRGISSSLRTLARDKVAYSLLAGSGRARTGDDEALEHLQDNLDQGDDRNIAASKAEHILPLEPGQVPRPGEEHASQPYWRASLEHEELEHTAPQDKLVTPEKGRRHEKESVKRRQKRQQWSPYEGCGKDDLMVLAASLQKSLESFESRGRVENEVASQLKPSKSLPVSPLVQALERKRAKKSSLKGGQKEELTSNPWATMLASPMRLCPATGVRLPKGLLVPWGLVRNPATEEVYFMPTELAELDSLQDKRRRSKPSASASASAKRPTNAEESPSNLEPDSQILQVKADTESDRKIPEVDLSTSHLQNNYTGADVRLVESPVTSQASKSSSPRPSSSMTYMLPFLPLLHHLTLRFTTVNKDMVTRRSRPNAINSILSWRLKASVDRAKFYAEQRAKTSPSSVPKGAAKVPSPNSLDHVKWDVDIDELMLRILRERLLAALEMLGNRNQKLWRRECELVKATRVTRTSDTYNQEGSWSLLGSDDHTQPVAGRGEGLGVKGAKICLLVESSGANSPMLDLAFSTKHNRVDKQEITQVSSDALSQSADSFASADDSWRSYSDLEPSAIQVDQSSSFPVFSLNNLFDADYISRFRQLSATIGVLAPRYMAVAVRDGGAYVLIVPAKAFGGNSVIEEVWRLWRFLGGRRA